ncbi:ATP-dependent DNA helicase PcrA [subsurface metagenome]
MWNEGLDEDSLAIAGYDGKYSSVIAGAGTGKSYALKRKVARLLEEGESPSSILAVTFTRTAARDIHNDLRSLGVEGCDFVRACTLHSLCYSILSRHEVFRVMERETRTLLDHEKACLIADLSLRLECGKKILKEQLLAFTAAWARLLNEEAGWPHTQEDRKFNEEMIAWLRFHKAMEIGELIPLTIKYLRNNPTCPERSQYKHIIVDEYQDLNKAEQTLVRLLSEYELPENRTLTVAGDDDQSIFVTLKYAHPEGIINFSEEYPGTFESTLTTCQRCPKQIIELANSFLISTNRKEQPKLLQPRQDANDGEISILQWRTLANEAEGIAKIIYSRISSGDVNAEDTLVLTPRKQIGYDIMSHLLALGINSQTCFSDAVLKNKKHAQEGYAYLSLLHNRNDAVSLRFLLGYDTNDKRSRAYERVRKHCFTSGDSVIDTLSKLHSTQLTIPYTEKLVERSEIINQRLQALAILTPEDSIDQLFPGTDEEMKELRDLSVKALGESDDIHDLYNLINAEITQPELPTSSDSVLILTLHKAKGLTAKMVVIVNCLEGCVPFVGDYESELEKQIELAEQERLFFVALTRTKNILIISSTGLMRKGDAARLSVMAGTNQYWTETAPSRFIDMLGSSMPQPQLGSEYIRDM